MPDNVEDTSIEPEPVGGTAQEREAEELANRVMRRAASLKGVKIDRGVFLRAELKKRFPEIDADFAVATTPIEAGLAPRDLDELALDVIDFEVKKCAALSFAAGVPGGFAMAGTVPADLAQYFAHVMRVEQKLAYLYGWHSFLNDEDEVDDETIAQLVMLMGVMLGVGGTANAVSQFAATTARHGIAKQVERQALTKTFFYNPLKKVLSFLGVKMTKQTFSKAVTKAVPVFGELSRGDSPTFRLSPKPSAFAGTFGSSRFLASTRFSIPTWLLCAQSCTRPPKPRLSSRQRRLARRHLRGPAMRLLRGLGVLLGLPGEPFEWREGLLRPLTRQLAVPWEPSRASLETGQRRACSQILGRRRAQKAEVSMAGGRSRKTGALMPN